MKKNSVLGVNFEKKKSESYSKELQFFESCFFFFKKSLILWVVFFEKKFFESFFFFEKEKQFFESYKRSVQFFEPFLWVVFFLTKTNLWVILKKVQFCVIFARKKFHSSHIWQKVFFESHSNQKKRVQFFDSFAEKKKIYSLSIFSKKSLVIFKNKINS